MAGIQIGGIASGFDTTAMVEKLMEAEQTRVDNVVTKRKLVEYTQEAYNEVNKMYSDFILNMRDLFGVNSYISNTGATRPSAANNLSWVNKATSSNDKILTAKPTSAATTGKHEITVHQLADSAKFASSSNVQLDGSKSISEQLGVDQFEITITTAKGTTTIKDTDGTMTFDQLVKEMNNIEGVSASYDASIGRFFLQTSETGADQFIQIEGPHADQLLGELHLNMTSGTKYAGQNAIIDYNGATGIEFSSNQFRIQGLELDLKGVNPGEKVTVTVEMDTEEVLNRMKTFVSEYNKLIEDIGTKLTEKAYHKDYPPLTDEQKKAMTDKEIELWEAKTKSGLIRNDSIIEGIQNSLRDALLQPVTLADGTSISLADFGITGKGYFEGGSKGQLTIDEDKFREAMRTKGDSFGQLMFATPSDSSLNVLDKGLSQSQLTQKRQQSGIFNRVTDIMVNGMQQLIQKAGTGSQDSTLRKVSSNILLDFVKSGSKSVLGTSISDYNKRIDDLNAKLKTIEARYWSQFSAMEKAISQMQSQSATLFSF